MDESLFHQHLSWAETIGRNVARGLPPSFDLEDLIQLARIAHWKRCNLYDPSTGVPYRAYAYAAIQGEVMMACRRRAYRDATHDELVGQFVDSTPDAEQTVLAKETRRNVTGPREYRQLAKVRAAIEQLPASEAYLLKRVYLDGIDIESLSECWGSDLSKHARRAATKLKRLIHAR